MKLQVHRQPNLPPTSVCCSVHNRFVFFRYAFISPQMAISSSNGKPMSRWCPEPLGRRGWGLQFLTKYTLLETFFKSHTAGQSTHARTHVNLCIRLKLRRNKMHFGKNTFYLFRSFYTHTMTQTLGSASVAAKETYSHYTNPRSMYNHIAKRQSCMIELKHSASWRTYPGSW